MPDYVAQLDTVFQFAFTNENADFYRRLYGSRIPRGYRVDSLAAWRAVPFLRKKDLHETPLLERIFTDIADADVLRTSSGTSGGGALMTPRNHPWLHDELYTRFTPTGFLNFGRTSYTMETHRRTFPTCPIVMGDFLHMESAVKLAAGFPINHVASLLFTYRRLVPLLEQYGMLEQIEVVETFGERIPPTEYLWLKKSFPNAIFYATYACTEINTNGLGVSIDAYDPAIGSLFVTGAKDMFMELVDVESGEVIEEAGREGEIVATTLWTEKNMTPMIRYCMGDLGMYVTYHDDPWQRVFTTRGRKDLDKINLAWGQLYVIEFDRAIAKFRDLVEPDYEFYFTHSARPTDVRPELRVVARADFDSDEFIEAFSREVRVAPSKTYADAVAEGLVAPMTCVIVPSFPNEGKKRLRFFERR